MSLRQQSGSGSESEDDLLDRHLAQQFEEALLSQTGEVPAACCGRKPPLSKPLPSDDEILSFDFQEIEEEIIKWVLANLQGNWCMAENKSALKEFGSDRVANPMPMRIGLTGNHCMWLARTVRQYIQDFQLERLWTKSTTIQDLLTGTGFALHAVILSGLGHPLGCIIKGTDAGLPEDDCEIPSETYVNMNLIMQMKASPLVKLTVLQTLGIDKPHLAFLSPSEKKGYYVVEHLTCEDLFEIKENDHEKFGRLWWPHLAHIRENLLTGVGISE